MNLLHGLIGTHVHPSVESMQTIFEMLQAGRPHRNQRSQKCRARAAAHGPAAVQPSLNPSHQAALSTAEQSLGTSAVSTNPMPNLDHTAGLTPPGVVVTHDSHATAAAEQPAVAPQLHNSRNGLAANSLVAQSAADSAAMVESIGPEVVFEVPIRPVSASNNIMSLEACWHEMKSVHWPSAEPASLAATADFRATAAAEGPTIAQIGATTASQHPATAAAAHGAATATGLGINCMTSFLGDRLQQLLQQLSEPALSEPSTLSHASPSLLAQLQSKVTALESCLRQAHAQAKERVEARLAEVRAVSATAHSIDARHPDMSKITTGILAKPTATEQVSEATAEPMDTTGTVIDTAQTDTAMQPADTHHQHQQLMEVDGDSTQAANDSDREAADLQQQLRPAGPMEVEGAAADSPQQSAEEPGGMRMQGLSEEQLPGQGVRADPADQASEHSEAPAELVSTLYDIVNHTGCACGAYQVQQAIYCPASGCSCHKEQVNVWFP